MSGFSGTNKVSGGNHEFRSGVLGLVQVTVGGPRGDRARGLCHDRGDQRFVDRRDQRVRHLVSRRAR